MTAIADDPHVTVLAAEYVELKAGAEQLAGTLKRAAQLGGVLELETAKREQLEAQRRELLGLLAEDPKRTRLPETTLYAARVALKLRHGALVRLKAREETAGIEPNEDLLARLQTCVEAGRKFDLQLDLLEHTDDEAEEE